MQRSYLRPATAYYSGRHNYSGPAVAGTGALRRQPFVNAATNANMANNPLAFATSRPRPGLPAKVPHSRPRGWLLCVDADTIPLAESSRDADEDAARARELAIMTLNRGVGITLTSEPRWHARPHTSQITMC